MNVLVIEQETTVANRIKEILFRIDESIHVVGVTDDMPAAEEWLSRNSVPDIILANDSVLAELESKVGKDIKATVTLSTKTEELNLRAYRYKTIRHMLNGVKNTNGEALNILSMTRNEKSRAGNFKERFLVKQGQKLLSIPAEQVAYFFSNERFIFLRTVDNQKYLLDYRMDELEGVLAPTRFFRINRSFIISMSSVKEIHAWFGHRLKLYLTPPAAGDVIVSKKRVGQFKAWLGK